MNNNDLIFLFEKRDPTAFEEAEKRFGKCCIEPADRLLCDERISRECFDNAVFFAWNNLCSDSPDDLTAYFLKATRKAVTDRVSGRSIYSQAEAKNKLISAEMNIESGNRNDCFDINAFLGKLTKEKRMTFVGRWFFFDSIDTISQKLGIPKSQVRQNILSLKNKAELAFEALNGTEDGFLNEYSLFRPSRRRFISRRTVAVLLCCAFSAVFVFLFFRFAAPSLGDAVQSSEEDSASVAESESFSEEGSEFLFAVSVADISVDTSSDASSQPSIPFIFRTNGEEATILGYTGSDTEIVIPNTISGWKVTAIGNNAFKGSNIASVSFGRNIKVIGQGAFMDCKSLSCINSDTHGCFSLPPSVTEVGAYAFAGCTELRAYYCDGTATLYNEKVFAGCTNLMDVSMSADTIHDGVFYGCVSLLAVHFRSLHILYDCFEGCCSLTQLILPGNLTVLHEGSRLPSLERVLFWGEPRDWYNVLCFESEICPITDKVKASHGFEIYYGTLPNDYGIGTWTTPSLADCCSVSFTTLFETSGTTFGTIPYHMPIAKGELITVGGETIEFSVYGGQNADSPKEMIFVDSSTDEFLFAGYIQTNSNKARLSLYLDNICLGTRRLVFERSEPHVRTQTRTLYCDEAVIYAIADDGTNHAFPFDYISYSDGRYNGKACWTQTDEKAYVLLCGKCHGETMQDNECVLFVFDFKTNKWCESCSFFLLEPFDLTHITNAQLFYYEPDISTDDALVFQYIDESKMVVSMLFRISGDGTVIVDYANTK